MKCYFCKKIIYAQNVCKYYDVELCAVIERNKCILDEEVGLLINRSRKSRSRHIKKRALLMAYYIKEEKIDFFNDNINNGFAL